MVRRQNEGSFGCEAVARALGQPNVPECAVGFHFLCLYAAKISYYSVVCFTFLLTVDIPKVVCFCYLWTGKHFYGLALF